MLSILYAQGLNNPIVGGSGTGQSFFAGLVRFMVGFFYFVGIIVFLFMLLSGGIQWISSSGDKGKVAAAQKRIVNALIGIGLMLSFYFLVSLIESAADISILQLDISRFSVSP